MKLPTPTQKEFRRLYEAAIAFKKEAPWERMTEDQVFGVRNPETDQIGYVSIMGTQGEHLALALYLGTEGLDGFWRMERGQGLDDLTFPFQVPQLQASFENRSELHAKDRTVIKSLGLKFRGRQAWPMFRSYRPGCFPWFVTPEEARFLAVGLEQALDVARRLKRDRTLLRPPKRGQYLVRTQTEQGWVDEWLTPPPIPMRPPPPVDTQRLTSMRKQLPRQRFTLQADLFAMPARIQETDDARPYLPYILLVVEARSGMIVGNELMAPKPSLEAVWEQTPTQFMDALDQMGRLPNQVAVRGEQLYNLLMPVAAGLGIRLKQARRLSALEQARSALEAWMA